MPKTKKLTPEQHQAIAQVVLEEVLTKALEEAESLAGSTDPEQQGRLFAYFDVLSWAKDQAEVFGVHFDDRKLESLDPYQLIGKPASLRKAA